MENSIWEKRKLKDTGLLSAVLDSSSDGILALRALRDSSGTIYDFECYVANSKAVSFFRRDKNELAGKRLLEEFPGMESAGVFRMMSDAVDVGETREEEIHINFDDFDNWLLMRVVKLGDGVVVTFSDITSKIQGQQKAKKQSVLINKVFNSTSDGLVILKPIYTKNEITDFEYLLLNDRAQKMLKQTNESISGKTVLGLYPGTQVRGILDLYKKTFETGAPFENEFFYDADGMSNWLRQRGIKLDRELLIVTSDITSERNAEREINDRNRFILRIAESSPCLLYLYDLRRRKFRYMNNRATELIGYSPEEIKRMGSEFIESMIHPYDQEAHSVHRQNLFRAYDSDVLRVDFRIRHRGGRWLWFRAYETVFERDADGLPELVVGTAENISGQKSAEDEMRKLKCLVDNTADFVGFANMDGYWEYLNDAARKLAGIDADDEINKTHILDFFLPRDREYVQTTILPVVRENGRWAGEIHFRNTKTSKTVPVSWSVFIVNDSHRRPLGIACVTRDLSVTKQRENLLEQSESRFRTLFEKSNDGIILLERNRIIDCNESAWKLFGATSKHAINMLYLWDVSPTFQRDGILSVEKAEDILQKAAIQGARKAEWSFKKLSGETFSKEVLLSPLSVGTQQIIQLVWRS